jgi:hypothetical protein
MYKFYIDVGLFMKIYKLETFHTTITSIVETSIVKTDVKHYMCVIYHVGVTSIF